MTFVVYSILFIFINLIGHFQLEAATLCAGNNATSEPVLDYCNSTGGYLVDRCCRSSDNETFTAVDLTDLNLTKIPDFTEYENFDFIVVDLRLNPHLEPSPGDDFLTMKDLDDLFLPEQVDCPGGERVWELVNKTADPPGNRCQHQKDFCSNSTDICVEQASTCSTNGPDHFLCLCKTGYNGYKCLRKGTFPVGAFFGPTIGVTVVASILFYWTQRRHVKK